MLNKILFTFLLLCCFAFSASATTIGTDPALTSSYIGFSDNNTRLGQSFKVNTGEAINTLDRITTWFTADYDGFGMDFDIYKTTDTATSLFNTQLTVNSTFNPLQIDITGINLSLDDNTDYLFLFTMTTSSPFMWGAFNANGVPFPPDAYTDGEYWVGGSGWLVATSQFGMPTVDLAFQAELSHGAVPEPSTMVLFGMGILGLARINRKKN